MRCSEPLRTSRRLLPASAFPHRAAAAPCSAVAELAVVRPLASFSLSSIVVKSFRSSVPFLAIALSLSAPVWAYAGSPVFEIRPVTQSTTSASQTLTTRYKGNVYTESVPVEPTTLLNDNCVKSADVHKTPEGAPSIIITLTETATKQWGAITTKYTGQRLAILLQGRLVSAPTIRQPLFSSVIELSGDFTDNEATEAAKKLNAKTSK